MKTSLPAASLILVWFSAAAFAHQLDEYLQATTISLEKDRIHAQIRLTPGVAVFASVMSSIDTDRDGDISDDEQRAYSKRVLGDLSLAVDADRLPLQLITAEFPKVDAMKEGLGQIQIDFAAQVRRGGSERKLVFENHHQRLIATYLVNCLVPRDPDIRVRAQKRNYEQSLYELEYAQGRARSGPLSVIWLVTVVLMAPLAVLWRRRVRAYPR